MKEKNNKQDMTVKEAGKKGGETTSKKYGKEFYEEIGKKGGDTTSKTHGNDFYEEIGHKGGQRVKELIDEGEESERNR